MYISIMVGRSMHSAVLIGLVRLAIIASVICCSSSVGASNIIRCLESERHALLQFHQGLVDESDVLASWKTEIDCCKWRGVSCNPQTGHVTSLDLSFDFQSYMYYGDHEGPLRGEISPSLLELRYLNYLDLSSNDFGGGMMIPKFIGSMSQLKELRLALANFSGHVPVQLGNLSNLHSLDLSLNDFQGTLLPDFIGSLSQLKQLRLYHANFSGPVPPQLANLSNLHTLDLSRNDDVSLENLEWLSHLSSLRYLNMSRLDLSKFVNWPRSLSKLTSITELVLSDCQLPDINLISLSSINSSASLQLLDLSANNLNSSIVDWIANVSNNFVSIRLSNNQLGGPVPNVFTSLPSLVTLDLSGNELEGGIPKGFQNLCSLESLILASNRLSENIEDSFKTLSCSENTLETLNLADNQFWGSWPDLKRFSKLRELNISNNQLNGYLPESVGQLSRLEQLSLSSNSLSGVITESHFLNLHRLRELDVSYNNFSINLSSGWNPPFHLTGGLGMSNYKLGPTFPKWILTQTNLTGLGLSNVGLRGPLPNKFWHLFSGLSALDLSSNQISGKLPNLSATSLSYVNLSSNLFSGAVPSFPTTVRILSLSNNMFSEPLSSFCATTAPDLTDIDISENLLSGELPNCWMQFERLYSLNLEKNELSGNIPSSLGTLKNIQLLRLNDNNFSEEVPSLENCTALVMVDLGNNNLSGRIPTWIGQRLTNLAILRLRSNQFDGIIPSSLCGLATIHVLDLSNNSISGPLPHCLNNITAMADDDLFNYFVVELAWKGKEIEFGENLRHLTSIDISSNSLIGEIPESITSMEKLTSLNLSRNKLTGKLPENFGNMKLLECLDLSRNQISGKIPASFSSLNFLSFLDLSYNQLSGRIPLGTQLQSFNASTYMGNLELCGQPLSPNCPGDETTEDSQNKEHAKDDLISWGFLISVVLGFIIGFWLVCGSLLLKTSWRNAYFKFLDYAKDWIYAKTVVFKTKMQRRLQR